MVGPSLPLVYPFLLCWPRTPLTVMRRCATPPKMKGFAVTFTPPRLFPPLSLTLSPPLSLPPPRQLSILLVLLLLLLGGLFPADASQASPLPRAQVPPPLADWTDWVLWDEPTHTCPRLEADPRGRPCAWPSRLELDLDGSGGRFTLEVAVFASRPIPVPLPGDGETWPQELRIQGGEGQASQFQDQRLELAGGARSVEDHKDRPLSVVSAGEHPVPGEGFKDQPLPVVSRDNLPVVWLPAGRYRLEGGFRWERLPAALTLPPQVALLALRVMGRDLAFPVLNEQGQVWLSDQAPAPTTPSLAAPEDHLLVQVFRRLEEGVPLRLTSRLVIEVAGRPREIVLPATLPPDVIPMALVSPLPARLEADGRLVLQARPGRWELTLQARYPAEVSVFPFPDLPAPWPAEELWVYQANTAVRLTEPRDAPALDPRQTELPADWQALPAFRMTLGVTLRLDVIRRGDPQPEPDHLRLQRRLWLDFDGRGLSVRDHITGTLTTGWRLDAGPTLHLGRVVLDGEPQSITLDQARGTVGVEVRRGQVDLSADSRLDRTSRLAATGWDRDFSQVSAELNLPPGWRLLGALGVDQAPGSWLAAWTLLDFFLVLVITLAVGRLFGWGAAALALMALILTWQEGGAPRYVWLSLLAAIALGRVLPTGSGLARWVGAFRLGVILTLALIAIPFLAEQLRLGLYPQLEHPYLAQPIPGQAQKAEWAGEGGMMPLEAEAYGDQAPATPPDRGVARSLAERGKAASRLDSLGGIGAGKAPGPGADLKRLDPDALTQTGPGLPDWRWNQVQLHWQGPVQAGQELRLVLIPPAGNLALAVLRLLLVAGLIFVLLGGPGLFKGPRTGWRWGPGKRQARGSVQDTETSATPGADSASASASASGFASGAASASASASLWFAGGLALLTLCATDTRAEALPGPELLNELKSRLLAPPDCQPHCAEIPTLTLTATPDQLRLELDVDAAAPVGIPLPAQAGQWLPSRVEIDGAPAPALLRGAEGHPWVLVAAGRQRLTLVGALPPRERISLPLPLRPRQVAVTSSGWRVAGVGDNGVPEVQLLLTREAVGAAQGKAVTSDAAASNIGALEAVAEEAVASDAKSSDVVPSDVASSDASASGASDASRSDVAGLGLGAGEAAVTGQPGQGQAPDDGVPPPPGAEPATLPPFLELERTLVLDLSWRVVSRLRRLTPPDAPLTLSIPLLPGEAVLTPGLKVSAGLLTAHLRAGETERVWESQLTPVEELTLTAPATQDWTEIWRLDASPIWHVQVAGLAPVHHQSPAGQWQPEWRPWASETLQLRISRPAGAPGASLTVDASELTLRPGDRATEARLRLILRASRGGRQPVSLPAGAELQAVTLDGIAQPIRLEEGQVLLPVHPGTQEAMLTWNEEQGIGTRLTAPAVGLGTPSVNATTRIELGQDRWVLWARGPTLGPAVLFWSLIPLILVAALALARLPLSPAGAWQWGLLLLGLTQAPAVGAVLVVAWLLVLAWRGAKGPGLNDWTFNLVQIGLVFLSFQALGALAAAIAEGLLGQPEMQIAGNGSGAATGVTQLLWYQDRSAETLPQPGVISVPLWVYRLLMLAWALWLANSLLNWLRWGWGCFSTGGLWRKGQRPAHGRWRKTGGASEGPDDGKGLADGNAEPAANSASATTSPGATTAATVSQEEDPWTKG